MFFNVTIDRKFPFYFVASSLRCIEKAERDDVGNVLASEASIYLLASEIREAAYSLLVNAPKGRA